MLFSHFLNKKIIITQIRSENKLVKRQKSTLSGLGLRGLHTNSELLASKDVLGMVRKVCHLITVSAV